MRFASSCSVKSSLCVEIAQMLPQARCIRKHVLGGRVAVEVLLEARASGHFSSAAHYSNVLQFKGKGEPVIFQTA